MRRLAPLVLGLLAACRQSAPADRDTTIAHAAGPTSTEMARSLQEKGLGSRTSGSPGAQASAGQPGVSAAPAFDANQRREYADVYVDLKDPTGQKALVSYLMKPEEWFLEKVVQLNPYLKHWRFWRVARTDGKSMPEVDPLRPKARR